MLRRFLMGRGKASTSPWFPPLGRSCSPRPGRAPGGPDATQGSGGRPWDLREADSKDPSVHSSRPVGTSLEPHHPGFALPSGTRQKWLIRGGLPRCAPAAPFLAQRPLWVPRRGCGREQRGGLGCAGPCPALGPAAPASPPCPQQPVPLPPECFSRAKWGERAP